MTAAVCLDRNAAGVIVPMEGGDVGGDVQVGTAWSVRYVPADNATREVKRALTLYVFATDEFADEDRPPGARFYDYCVMTEDRTYTGDADDITADELEIDCDYSYEHPSINGFATVAEADEAAKEYASEDFSRFISFADEAVS